MKTSMPGPCAEWAELLAAVFPADLAPADRAALGAHLATCPACAAVKADYQRMDARIRALPAPRPLDGLPPRLLQLWAEEDRRAGSRQPVSNPRVPEVFMQTTPHPGASAPAPTPLHPERPLRRRLISAMTAVAAVLIVLSIAIALLASRAGPGSPTSRGGTAAPTLTPGTSELTINGLLMPTLAPGNPQIIYQAQLSSDSPPAAVTLRRSDDAGTSWHSLPVPKGITLVDWAAFFVSPFNARQVFLEVNAACSTAQTSGGARAAVSFGGGLFDCTFDYISTDGGAHWKRVHWPVHGTDTSHTRLGELYTYTYSPFKTQGNRLYALLRTGTDEGSSFVVSEDSGLTWQFADQSLANQGNCVYDYAPTPTGATVFAVIISPCYSGGAHLNSYTSPQRPESGGGGNELWRSDDAGAHWTRVGPIALTPSAQNLLARLNSAGQPVLYDDGFLLPGTASGTMVSTDGGKIWSPAPSGVTKYADSTILGTLSDGSIIEAFQDMKTHRDQLFAWKAGETGWRRISPDFPGTPQYVLAVPSGGGHETLWLVSVDQGNFNVQHFTLP